MFILTSELREQSVFNELLIICDGLEARLLDSSEEEVALMVNLVSFDISYSMHL
jgi:hypothetical protein